MGNTTTRLQWSSYAPGEDSEVVNINFSDCENPQHEGAIVQSSTFSKLCILCETWARILSISYDS